jgi:TLC domain
MLDPFPIPPPKWLSEAVTPFADRFALYTLPLHIHEVLFFFVFYQCIQSFVSPWISNKLVPYHYHKLSRRTRLNWDVHVVSFVQSVLVCILALWVMVKDKERSWFNKPKGKDGWWSGGWEERVWGYTGGLGLVQAAGCGYFLWDLVVSTLHLDMFGLGLLAHAISALIVFSFGFVGASSRPHQWLQTNRRLQRPFVNYYAPTFILYELSSPFLNIHWFCDKLDLTGSATQLINGFFLLGSFFGCRLVWGSWQSICVFIDVWKAGLAGGLSMSMEPKAGMYNSTVAVIQSFSPSAEVLRFANPGGMPNAVPLWLAGSYLIANICLNGLNWYWFSKMIATIRKRFPPPLGTMRVVKKEEEKPILVETDMGRAVYADGHKSVELEQTEIRRRHLEVPPKDESGSTSEEEMVP